jgi:hypothetical protein
MAQQQPGQEVARAEQGGQDRDGLGIERASELVAVAGGQVPQAAGGIARPGGEQQVGQPALAGREKVRVLPGLDQGLGGLCRLRLPDPFQQLERRRGARQTFE